MATYNTMLIVVRYCKCISVVWCSRKRAIDLEDPGSINCKGKMQFCVHSSYESGKTEWNCMNAETISKANMIRGDK